MELVIFAHLFFFALPLFFSVCQIVLCSLEFSGSKITPLTGTGLRAEAQPTRPATAANAGEFDGKIRTRRNPLSGIEAPNSGHDNFH
jgi:hypothetical protein